MADTGYTSSTDSLTTKDYGYRSDELRQPNSFFTRDAEISYNGFHFPPMTNCKATIVPEYDKSGRTVKHLVIALTVEFIITKWNSLSSANPTIDEEMEEIRKRLMQPGQPLEVFLQGVGNVVVNTTSLNRDVNYGPKPQVFDWQPLAGGLAARGEWLVVTWVSPCFNDGGTTPNSLNGISDFSYDLVWDVNEQGFITRTVTGEIEVAGVRQPTAANSAGTVVPLSGTNAVLDKAIEAIKVSFPRLEGFHRHENFSIDKAKKKLKYVVTDTEIPTDQVYPKGIINLDFDEELDASFEDRGFSIWNWSFTASASVSNAGIASGSSITQNKNLAFLALAKIIRKRKDNITGKVFMREGASVEDVEAYRRKVTIFPNKIKIGNDLFGNSLSLDMSFTLLCTSDLIFAATGMYDSINKDTGWKWKEWVDHLNKTGVNATVVNMVPGQEIIIDLCHPLAGSIGPKPNPISQKDTSIRVGTKADIFGPEIEDAESSWIDYRNTFYFLDRNFTTVGVVTSGSATEEQEQASGNPASSTTDTGDNQKEKQGSDSKRGKPELQTSSEPIHYVTMIGSAIRVGFPIEAPKLISVGKANAKLTGDNLVKRSSRPSGWERIATVGGRTQRLGTVNIYKLAWRKTYVLDDAPAGWKATTTGEPQQFL